MKIEHIVSTMRREEFSFLENLKLQESCLVVNQKCDEKELSFKVGDNGARILCTPEIGLSRSRNMLIKNATGDVCIMGDDDVEYLPGYLEAVKEAYEQLPKADIIAFRFTHEKGRETRARYSKIKRLRLWNISKVASVEITFKRESIINAGLSFNNEIGLGTSFPSSEENAFLADALRAGLRIYHVPKTICLAIEAHGLQNEECLQDYLITKGAAFHCIYKRWFWLFSLGFIVMKKRSLFRGVSIRQAYKWMKTGRRQYKEIEEKK